MRIRPKVNGPGSGCAIAAALMAAVLLLQAVPPHIDLIEPFLTNQVLLHFNMQANHTHTVQRCSSFIPTSNGLTAVWSNIITIEPLPFDDHWVAVDTNQTLPVRLYRLMVTPK